MWKVGFYLLQRGASDNTMIRLCTNPRSDVIQDRLAIENTASSPGTKSLHRNGKKRCWSSEKIFLCPTFHHSKPIYIYIWYDIYIYTSGNWTFGLKGTHHWKVRSTVGANLHHESDISPHSTMLNARMPKPSPTLCNMWAEAWPFVSRPLHLHDTHQKIWACPHFATIRWVRGHARRKRSRK